MKELKAVIHSRKALHEGFLKVYQYRFDVEEHGGGITRLSREVMERDHAVAVLGHDPKRDEVVLGNEFRPGVLVAVNIRIGTILLQGPSMRMNRRLRRQFGKCGKKRVLF
jgi:hypothetical protein